MKEKTVGQKIRIGVALLAVAAIVGLILYIIIGTGSHRDPAKNLAAGERYLEETDYEKAVAVFKKIIREDPDCEEAYQGLYEAYLGLGEEEKAEDILKNASKVSETEEIFFDPGEAEKPGADFEKMDAWLLSDWEKESDLQKLCHPNLMNGVYYTLHYDVDDSWNRYNNKIERFDPYTGERSIILEEENIDGSGFCVVDNKIYFASSLQYRENAANGGITVTEPAKLWAVDLETKEKTLLCDEIYMEVDRIMPLEDGLFLSGYKMEDCDDYFDWLGGRDWNMVIGYDGEIIVPLREKIWSGVANALILGEHLVTDGENTYAGLSRLNSRLEEEWSINASDYEETVALSDNKLFYTDSTGTQCDVNPIEYLKYVDLSTGKIHSTGLDARYRDLTLLEIPCVLNSMAYAVYTNIPIVDDGDDDWDDYMFCDIYDRNTAIQSGFTEEKGYYYYFYRYDLKKDQYIPLNEAAIAFEK